MDKKHIDKMTFLVYITFHNFILMSIIRIVRVIEKL